MSSLPYDFYYGQLIYYFGEITFVWFFSSMCTCMHSQCTLLKKYLCTKSTFKWPFSRMILFMNSQFPFFSKCFFTQFTFIWLFLQYYFFYGDSYCFCQQIPFHTYYMSMVFLQNGFIYELSRCHLQKMTFHKIYICMVFIPYEFFYGYLPFCENNFSRKWFILLFSRMQSFLGYQILFFWKCFFKEITFECFYSIVSFIMTCQWACLCECLFT